MDSLIAPQPQGSSSQQLSGQTRARRADQDSGAQDHTEDTQRIADQSPGFFWGDF